MKKHPFKRGENAFIEIKREIRLFLKDAFP
jgi:hypothetical protein